MTYTIQSYTLLYTIHHTLYPLYTIYSYTIGAMGISNEAIGEISVVERVVIKQDIEFDDCMARNGAPWTSCRELKSLAPHKGASVLEYPAIKIKDLPRNLKYVCMSVCLCFYVSMSLCLYVLHVWCCFSSPCFSYK